MNPSKEALLELLGLGATEWNMWRESQLGESPEEYQHVIKAITPRMSEEFREQVAHSLGAGLQRVDLQGVNLGFFNLDGVNFVRVDLSGSCLEGVTFDKADLQMANFAKADLSEVGFAGANLQNAQFTSADLRGATFHRTEVTGASFKGADLRDAVFTEVDLSYADFVQVDFTGAMFGDCKLNVPPAMSATMRGLETVRGLPHGLYADAVAAGYKPRKPRKRR